MVAGRHDHKVPKPHVSFRRSKRAGAPCGAGRGTGSPPAKPAPATFLDSAKGYSGPLSPSAPMMPSRRLRASADQAGQSRTPSTPRSTRSSAAAKIGRASAPADAVEQLDPLAGAECQRRDHPACPRIHLAPPYSDRGRNKNHANAGLSKLRSLACSTVARTVVLFAGVSKTAYFSIWVD
jgi:hypothetical protein